MGLSGCRRSACLDILFNIIRMITSWFNSQKKITLSLLIAFILSAFIWFFLLPKTVAVVIDGDIQAVTTRALRVQGALEAVGVNPAEASMILPAPDAWLKDEEVIQVYYAFTVNIRDGGEDISLQSIDRMPENWLTVLDTPLQAGDKLLYQGQAIAANQVLDPARYYEVTLRRVLNVRLTIDGEQFTFPTTAITLGEALLQHGIRLYVADVLLPAPETMLTGDIQASLKRARSISITVDGQEIAVLSAEDTVGAVLAEAGLALQNLDYSIPAANELIPEEGQIRVVRVREELVLTQKLLPFNTLFQPLPEVEIDNLAVAQVGEYGVEAQRIRVRYEDGEEISRELEDAWVAREPVPRIEGYGTKIVIRTLDTGNGVIEYWRAVDVYATSYSVSRSGTSPDAPWYGLTYSGVPLQTGHIAVLRS